MDSYWHEDWKPTCVHHHGDGGYVWVYHHIYNQNQYGILPQ